MEAINKEENNIEEKRTKKVKKAQLKPQGKKKRRRRDDLKYDFMPSILEIIDKPANKGGKIIIWTSFMFVIAAVVWASFSKTDVVVTGAGSVNPVSGVDEIQMPYAGVVKEVKVGNGDYVNEGDVIACIETDNADIDLEDMKLSVQRLNKEKEIYQQFLDGTKPSDVKTSEMTTDENIKLDLDYIVGQEEIYLLGISDDYDDDTKDKIKKQHRIELLGKINNNNLQLQEFKKNISKYEEQIKKQELKAAKSGIVTGLAGEIADKVVQPGTVLMYVIPKGCEMEVEAAVSTADIGSIEVGDRVAIKVDAYPYNDYGLVDGEIIYIANAAMSDGNGGYNYRVKVKITSDDLEKRNIILSTGMIAQIEIKTGRRSVMNYFLDPLKKGVNNSLKEE